MSLGCLTVPHGDGRGVDAVSKAGNNTSDDKLRNAERSYLERSADAKNRTPEHDGSSSTKTLAVKEGENGTKQAPDFVDRNHRAL